MGFQLLPMVVVVFFLGVMTQLVQLSGAVPGAGVAGRAESLAQVTAQQAEAFGVVCLNKALATPGAISASIAVTMPAGVLVPRNAVCTTTAGPAGSRNVLAYMPGAAGAPGRIVADTASNSTWFSVQATGAVSLNTGLPSPLPAAIPVGYLLNWSQVTP